MLQKDFDVLLNWSHHWLLKLNVAECKVMHCGTPNTHKEYHMKQASNKITLGEATPECDLGINVSNRCAKMSPKAKSEPRPAPHEIC